MKIREAILYAAAASALGLGAALFWHTDTPEEKRKAAEAEIRLTPPANDGPGFDAFTVALLQAALQTQPSGNVLVAPDSTAALLGRLKELSGGGAREVLEALPLPEELTLTSAHIRELSLIFPDLTLPLCPGRETEPDIVPVPFHQAVADAFVAINKTVALYSENGLERTADGEIVSSDTSLLVFSGAAFQADWMQPVDRENTKPADFFNGNGGMPRVPMMSHRGTFRIACAENGEWEAVAFFLRNAVPEADSACMVAILPKESSARAFADKLSPAILGEICRQLYDAEPEPCTVEIPRLIYPPLIHDEHARFSQLGLGSLFMEESPLTELSKSSPLHIDRALQQCSVQLTESPGGMSRRGEPGSEAPPPVRLRFDRPFIWFIGNLTAPTPPYLMGIVEDL